VNAIAKPVGAPDAAAIRWREERDPDAWDRALAKLGGHPLQSALWGEARREVDGIESHRFVAEGLSSLLMMARIETRRVPLIGAEVGWIPRGPVGNAGAHIDAIAFRALAETTDCHPALMVTDRWQEATAPLKTAGNPETIWIDLAAGKDKLWQDLDRRVRQSVGRARRSNVTVERSLSKHDVEAFSRLSRQISERKNFELALSPALVGKLLSSDPSAPASAHLFVARANGAFAAAALILKIETSIHYMAGGTDREFSRERVGEVLHWSIIEWGIEQGARLYDLEGIDRRRNPGTFAFKKKMGGREVVLAGKAYYPQSTLGMAVAAFDRGRGRFGLLSGR
jgi:CelD/BcsL family acetyltransferase involved in cellulose biosynthesis